MRVYSFRILDARKLCGVNYRPKFFNKVGDHIVELSIYLFGKTYLLILQTK